VCRLLRTTNRSGVLEHPEEPERSIDRPEHRQLIRQAATEGIVLLKNEDQALPLDPEQLRSIAVIGPNAKSAPIMGGGSARVNPHYVITSWQGIIDRCPDDIEIGYEQGCTNYRDTPLLDPAWLAPAEGEGPGLTIEYYDSLDLTGEPVLGQVTSQMRWFWWGDFAEAVDAQRFSVRLSGTLTPPESGTYAFSLSSRGLSRLFIDGEQVVDNWTDYQPAQRSFGKSGNEVFGELELEAGQSYGLVIEYSRQGASPVGAMRVGCLPAMPGDLMERAVQLAARADVALLFIGTNDEWESEGFDRPDMDLPGRQAELLEKVVAANPNTIVILNTGSPIIMPWLDTVPAVLQAWFPGQECGNAIASILFGDADPSGRLPQTFPVRLQDNPAYINYPGENDRVVYGEGLFVGYRYYDRKEIEPLFPFGYGLSYTTFDIDHLQLSASKYKLGQQIELSVEVTNTGSRAGKQVVQLYVRDVECSLTRPDKELKRFSKVSLDPGEQQEVQFVLTQEDLAFYDDLAHEWVAEAGTFEILVGVSSRDIAAVASFQLVESTDEQPEPTTQASGGEAGLSKQSVLRDILAHPQGEAVLREHFGDMIDAPQLNMAMGLSLEQIAGYVPNIVTDEKLDAVDRALQKL
jgi:beta-glucosidase